MGAHPGIPEDRLGVESGVAETPAIRLVFWVSKKEAAADAIWPVAGICPVALLRHAFKGRGPSVII